MIYYWRRKIGCLRLTRRFAVLLGLSIVLASGLPLGALFSSRISNSMGTDVLISSQNCGYLYWEHGISTADENSLLDYTNRQKVETSAYAQSCYEGRATILKCATFAQERVQAKVSRNTSCPFDPEICLLGNENLSIDTGYIDSHNDLGLNTPPKDRFRYRRVMACAPLRTEGYSEVVNKTIGSCDFPFMNFIYGPQGEGRNYMDSYPMFRAAEFSVNAADYTIM